MRRLRRVAEPCHPETVAPVEYNYTDEAVLLAHDSGPRRVRFPIDEGLLSLKWKRAARPLAGGRPGRLYSRSEHPPRDT